MIVFNVLRDHHTKQERDSKRKTKPQIQAYSGKCPIVIHMLIPLTPNLNRSRSRN